MPRIMANESVFDTLKELMAVSNPGLVTKDDLLRLESRVAELEELVDELEDKLAARGPEA